jgi:hypothetical protein
MNYSENIVLVWLDSENDSSFETKCRTQIIDSNFNEKIKINFFTDAYSCKKFIFSASANSKIFLITSGSLGEFLIKDIHTFDNVISIYIYCYNVNFHSKWAEKYSKISCVESYFEKILNGLTRDMLLNII